ncbi:MAG: DUF1549 domain-containing protein [Verrucomicrobiaceae bacterium]|nr:DUF1549 domain-containing protein [Verrucomicrobiaceae bacterium]
MKSKKAILLGLGCIALGLSPVRGEETSRIWTDKQGRQVEAMFLGIEGDNISLQTNDGRTFTFALSNLSADDQAFAKTAKPAPGYVATNATIGAAAQAIDRLVTKGLEKAQAKIVADNAKIKATGGNMKDLRDPPTPNPLMSDEQFIRRVYLDIVGRIPNYEEVKTFLDDNSGAVKRAKLIDKLLDDPGYAAHLYNYFADMLRVREDLQTGNNLRGTPYVNWLKHQCETNASWDNMVYEMLTAKGKMWDPPVDAKGNPIPGKVPGAAGYLLRDIGMPLDNLANTLAVFLGTDVACAQCHDHPFADWTQYQFYQMASFFGATTTDMRTQARRLKTAQKERERDMALREEIDKMITAGGGDADRERTGINQFMGANRFVVSDTQENMMKLPHDYKYKDHKPYDPVEPKFITWSQSDKSLPAYKQKLSKEEGLRNAFAKWVVDPSNPRFAMAIANRMWKRAFGVAIAEPVTNIDDPAKASNPELLMHLASEMKRVKFNLKDFMRIVYNTRSYQREATTGEVHMGEHYYFQGPLLRRMSAEQAWDSYMTLTLGSPDNFTKTKAQEDLYSKSIDLDLQNPKLDAKTVLMKYAAFRKMGEKMRDMAGMSMEMMNQDMKSDTMMADSSQVGAGMRRASELEQPVRGGHFLADFGQSQRLLIDGAGYGGSVPQVLSLMNGDAQSMLTSSNSLIFTNMQKLATDDEKIQSVFLSVMSRKASDKEMELAKKTVAGGSEGYSNLVWALINTREFIFVQ